MAVLLMLQCNIDVLVLTDTQHTVTSAGYYKKSVQRRLGGSTKLYASDTCPRKHERRVRGPPTTKSTRTHPHRNTSPPMSKRQCPMQKKGPSGVMIVVGTKWGPSLINGRSDDSGHGTLAEIKLRTTNGTINILGTYWPEKPAPSHVHSTALNLWSRVTYWLREQHIQSNPITYLQDLAIKWAHTALRNGSDSVILAGDLNSRWNNGDSGGQRSVERWCDENFLINGPKLISDHIAEPFITRGHELDDGTWIDHILHVGDISSIDVIGAFNAQGSEWEGVTSSPLGGIQNSRTFYGSSGKTSTTETSNRTTAGRQTSIKRLQSAHRCSLQNSLRRQRLEGCRMLSRTDVKIHCRHDRRHQQHVSFTGY